MANNDTTRTRTRRKAKKNAAAPSSRRSIGAALTIVTIFTVALTLLGYGFDFGYLEVFGLYPEQLQRTPLDYLQRSYRAIFVFLEYSKRLEAALSSADMYWEMWLRACRMFLALAIGSTIVAYLTAPDVRPRIARMAGTLRRNRCWEWLMARPRVRAIQKSLSTRPALSRLLGYGAPTAFVVLPFAFYFVVVATLWLLVTVFSICVVIVPFTPATAAAQTARKDVIDPDGCRSIAGVGSSTHAGARCIRLVRQGCEVARGRYIEQSANRVWLLTKRPWNVRSAPLEGNVTEEVSEELPPAGTRICQRDALSP